MAKLAPSLVRARVTIDARWPNRDRASDGWIGDPAHQGRTSDHNPNGRAMVDALDIDMYGGPNQVHRPTIVAAGILHPAVNYVIHDWRIYQANDMFRPRDYNGINPHAGHCHYSIRQTTTAEGDPTPWSILAAFPAWPMLRKGMTGTKPRQLQAYLNAWGASLACDGELGSLTDQAIRAYQEHHGLAVDGLVGPLTRGKLFS